MENGQYRVLVIGGGGREHALCRSLFDSDLVVEEGLFCAPGNAGTEEAAKNVPLNPKNSYDVVAFCRLERIDLVVVGPEEPLVNGLGDVLRKAGILVFGPNADGAMIEASKDWADELMKECGIPKADSRTFTEEYAAVAYLQEQYELGNSIVIKADGLAAGKGVVLPTSLADAVEAVHRMFAGQFGTAGKKVLIAERLRGRELSVLAITDGTRFVMLPEARDHKRLLDGDQGPNTGGMGAYSPVPDATEDVLLQVKDRIFAPLLLALLQRGIDYRGIIYAGVMICDDGIVRVIEFNCRFGDPETQVVLPRIGSDIVQLLVLAAEGDLSRMSPLVVDNRAAVCVVLAAEGYPNSPRRGDAIEGLSYAHRIPRTIVYHAGTIRKGDIVQTNGGRVFGITGLGRTMTSAYHAAYVAANEVLFSGRQFRTDIARDVAE